MTGRRETQKAERRQRMLAAALRLFDRRGFRDTTMEDIAAAADLGVATVYNYFGSKEGIVAELLRTDLAAVLAAGQRVVDAPPRDPAEAMVRLLAEYGNVGGREWSRRELLRMTIFPGLDNTGTLTAAVLECEAGTQRQIAALLQRCRAEGTLSSRLPVRDATALVFAVMNQHFGAFLTQPAATYRATFRRLARQVRLLFEDWRAPGSALRRRR